MPSPDTLKAPTQRNPQRPSWGRKCSSTPSRWTSRGQWRKAVGSEAAPSGCPDGSQYVPEGMRAQVIQWGHSSRLSGHPGSNRTLTFIQRKFWWPEMREDVQNFVAACSVCAQAKVTHQSPQGLLQPLPIPHRPWSHIALDFVTGLPPSNHNTTILTIIDRFSKAVHFIPLTKLPSASETAQLLIAHVVRLHGIPTDIVSDRGTPVHS